MLITWISETLTNLKFDEDAFLNVILRNPEDLEEKEEEPELPEDANEEDYELIYDQDYEFDSL